MALTWQASARPCREAGIDLSVVSPVRLGRELCGLLRMDRRGNIPLIDDQEYGKNCESYSQAIQHKSFKDNDNYRRDYCVQVLTSCASRPGYHECRACPDELADSPVAF